MEKPTPEQNAEMLSLRDKAQEWIDSLLVAGVDERSAVSAFQLALVERLLVAGGVDDTVRWLAGWQHMAASAGEELLGELRKPNP